MSYAIRQIGLPDRHLLFDAVARFSASGDDGAPVDRRRLEDGATAFVADTRSFAFVVVRGDELVGWAWGQRVRRPDGPEWALLERLEVAESDRRRGVGGLLLDAVVAHARQVGCSELVGLFDGTDEAAVALTRSAGGTHDDGLRARWVFPLPL